MCLPRRCWALTCGYVWMWQEEEERVNKLRQEVSEEKQRQMDELAKESEDKKKLLEDLNENEAKQAAALAEHEAENQLKLDKLKREYEERERELEAEVSTIVSHQAGRCLCGRPVESDEPRGLLAPSGAGPRILKLKIALRMVQMRRPRSPGPGQ